MGIYDAKEHRIYCKNCANLVGWFFTYYTIQEIPAICNTCMKSKLRDIKKKATRRKKDD